MSARVGKALVIIGIVAFVAGIGVLIFGVTAGTGTEIGLGIKAIIGGLISYFCGRWEIRHVQRQNIAKLSDALTETKVRDIGGGKPAEQRDKEAWEEEMGMKLTEEQLETLRRGEAIELTEEQTRKLQEEYAKQLQEERSEMEVARQRILTELDRKIREAQRTGAQTIELDQDTIEEYERITGEKWPGKR